MRQRRGRVSIKLVSIDFILTKIMQIEKGERGGPKLYFD